MSGLKLDQWCQSGTGQQEKRQRANLIAHCIALKQSTDSFNNKPDAEVKKWHHALLGLIKKHVTKSTAEYPKRFPKRPTSSDMHQWERWTAWCIAEMSRAKQEKKKTQ